MGVKIFPDEMDMHIILIIIGEAFGAIGDIEICKI